MREHVEKVLEVVDDDANTLDNVVEYLLDDGVRLNDALAAVVHAIADGQVIVENDSGFIAMPVPEVVKKEIGLQPDVTKLSRLSGEYLHMVADGTNVDRLAKVRDEIFETAIETIFGANIWRVLNRIER